MKRDWWDKEFKVLMTLGESTTAGGWSSCRERCWANQLARLINEFQRIPVQLVNVGIGANVISTKSPCYEFSGKPAANERLERHVLSHFANGHHLLPDLLVISYGLNDARGGTPVDLFCAEMEDILRRVRKVIQPLIVLLGPYYMTDFALGAPHWSHGSLELFHQYNEATRQLAERLDCLFVDLLSAYSEADWLVHHDGVHANDLGHRIVANGVFEALASNCSGLALETRNLEQHIVPWRDESTLQRGA
ncbi:MAG: SGNH/GDSL hydrolase family protein [Armatimonadetes bacterium]|nr:SGNH/GDSL hydrolase family protein [Armatimonadota bacterium]